MGNPLEEYGEFIAYTKSLQAIFHAFQSIDGSGKTEWEKCDKVTLRLKHFVDKWDGDLGLSSQRSCRELGEKMQAVYQAGMRAYDVRRKRYYDGLGSSDPVVGITQFPRLLTGSASKEIRNLFNACSTAVVALETVLAGYAVDAERCIREPGLLSGKCHCLVRCWSDEDVEDPFYVNAYYAGYGDCSHPVKLIDGYEEKDDRKPGDLVTKTCPAKLWPDIKMRNCEWHPEYCHFTHQRTGEEPFEYAETKKRAQRGWKDGEGRECYGDYLGFNKQLVRKLSPAVHASHPASLRRRH